MNQSKGNNTNQPSRTSKFINLDVWCYSEVGSWNITDSVTNFSYSTSRTSMIQDITLGLNMSSGKLKSTGIGLFKEKYVIVVELFDSSQKTVVDTITFDTSVLRYNGFDISEINQDSKPHNDKDIAFSIDLFNTVNEGAFININKVLEKTTYKKVVKYVMKQLNDNGVYNFEIDPSNPEISHIDQFFIPDMRLYAALPYVLNRGYSKRDVVATYITNKGLCIYTMSKTKTRKKIKTTIYPTRESVRDFEDIFVTDFKVIRDPSVVLRKGRKQPIFSTSEYRHRYHMPRYADKKIKNPIFLPHLYKNVQTRTYVTNSDIDDINAINSFEEHFRLISMIELTLNRWKKFVELLPMRNLYVINITGASYAYLSSEYFIHSSTINITRDNNEFIANAHLTLQVAEIS